MYRTSVNLRIGFSKKASLLFCYSFNSFSFLLFISVCVSVFFFFFFLIFSCLLNLYIICPKQQNPQLPSVKSVKRQFLIDRSTSLAVPVVQIFIKDVSIT